MVDYDRLRAATMQTQFALEAAALTPEYGQWFESRSVEWAGFQRWRYEQTEAVLDELGLSGPLAGGEPREMASTLIGELIERVFGTALVASE